MDNYVKAEKDEEFTPDITIDETKDNVTVMRVKSGSKTKNLIQFAEKKLSNESETQIIWEGSGDAVHKTITCAEIMKKKFSHSLHQITRLSSMTIVETWKPRIDGLDDMRVKRHLPLIKILLSKEPLPADANGYQAPEDVTGLFDRGSGGGRNKPGKSQQHNRNKRRNNKSNAEADGATDGTLLADSNRRKDYEKKNKLERKKKKAAAAGGGKDNQNSAKQQHDSASREATPMEREIAAVTKQSSGDGASSVEASSFPESQTKSPTEVSEVTATDETDALTQSSGEKMIVE